MRSGTRYGKHGAAPGQDREARWMRAQKFPRQTHRPGARTGRVTVTDPNRPPRRPEICLVLAESPCLVKAAADPVNQRKSGTIVFGVPSPANGEMPEAAEQPSMTPLEHVRRYAKVELGKSPS